MVYDLQMQYSKKKKIETLFPTARVRLNFDRSSSRSNVANFFAVPFLNVGFQEAEGAQYLESFLSLLLVG